MDLQELCQEWVEKMRIPTFEEDAQVVVRTLLKAVSNIVRYPGEPRYRSLRVQNASVVKITELYENSLEFLVLLGFKLEGDRISLLRSNASDLHIGLTVLKEAALSVGISQDEVNTITGELSISAETFDPYASMVVNIGAATKPLGGNSKMEDEVQRLEEKREAIMKAAGIPDRRLRVFEPKTSSEAKRFSLKKRASLAPVKLTTSNDSAVVKEAVKSKLEAQRRSQKFSTKAMRDLEKLKRSKVFTQTVIRVQFPDRTILEARFSPTETMHDVLAHVNKCLKEPKVTPVVLYQTPPYRVLDLNTTLDKLGLKPAALIHAAWEKDAPENDYLRPDLEEQLYQQREQKNVNTDAVEYPKTSVNLVDDVKSYESKAKSFLSSTLLKV